jgi:hypothetical protein
MSFLEMVQDRLAERDRRRCSFPIFRDRRFMTAARMVLRPLSKQLLPAQLSVLPGET